jgi:hypothetical protein
VASEPGEGRMGIAGPAHARGRGRTGGEGTGDAPRGEAKGRGVRWPARHAVSGTQQQWIEWSS